MASLHDKPDYGLRWFLHPVLNPVGHERCKGAVCASGTVHRMTEPTGETSPLYGAEQRKRP